MKIKNNNFPIENCKIFCNINEDELNEAFDKIHFQVKSFIKDNLILSRNEKCNNLMIILRGIVKTEVSDLKGATIHIADIEAADTLAPAFLFGKSNLLPVDIFAKTDVKILFIPQKEIYKLFKISPQFLTNFLDLISERTQFLVHKIRFLSFNTLKGKMAFYLLRLFEEKKSDIIRIIHTQNELAENFGATRTSVARVLKQLNSEKIIKVKGKTIELLNKQKLSECLNYKGQMHFSN